MKVKYFLIALLSIFCGVLYGQEFAVELKQKNLEGTIYNIEEYPIIKALSLKHGTTLKQSYPGAKNPDLLLYYTLKGFGNKDTIVNDYLATGLFEDTVRVFDTVYLPDAVMEYDFVDNMLLFPNPVKNTFTISGKIGGIENVKVGIYDTVGKIVFEKEHFSDDVINIDVSNLAAGMYFIKITIDNQPKITKKIVKK